MTLVRKRCRGSIRLLWLLRHQNLKPIQMSKRTADLDCFSATYCIFYSRWTISSLPPAPSNISTDSYGWYLADYFIYRRCHPVHVLSRALTESLSYYRRSSRWTELIHLRELDSSIYPIASFHFNVPGPHFSLSHFWSPFPYHGGTFT